MNSCCANCGSWAHDVVGMRWWRRCTNVLRRDKLLVCGCTQSEAARAEREDSTAWANYVDNIRKLEDLKSNDIKNRSIHADPGPNRSNFS